MPLSKFGMKIKRMLDKFLFQLKIKGAKVVLHRSLGKLFPLFFEKKILVFLEGPPTEERTKNLPKMTALCRLGTIEDTEVLAQVRGRDDGQEVWWRNDFRRRFQDDRLCFIAFLNDEVACNIWVSLEQTFDPYIQKNIRIEKGEALIYDIWWSYKHRGKRITHSLFEFMHIYLTKRGVFNAVGYTTTERSAPLRLWKACGYQETGRIIFLRFFVFRWFLSGDKAVQRFV